MSTRVKVTMKPVNAIVNRLGAGKNGDVQRFVTSAINRRITRYMPALTETMAAKLKFVKSPTEIEVLGPYARYQYYGKAMEGSAPKTATGRDLQYTKDKHPLAGSYYDRRMMAAEGARIVAEVQEHVNRKAGKP